jgi:HlyD family secretion protein
VELAVLALGTAATVAMWPVKVTYATAVRGTAIKAVYATGIVEAADRVEVKARVGGPVQQIDVREGDAVEKDQQLARIDVPALDYDVERGRADLAASQARADEGPQIEAIRAEKRALAANLKQARADLARVVKLAESGSVADAELERTRANVEALAQRAAVLNAHLREASIGLRADAQRQRAILGSLSSRANDAQVRSPIAGTVLARHVAPGEVVTANQPLFRVGDVSKLRVEAEVDEAEVAQVKVGMPAAVRVYGLEDTVFPGRVELVAPDADRGRKTYRVHVVFDQPLTGARPGMTAQVNVVVTTHEGVVLVPREAVVTTGQDAWVWVIDRSNRAVRRPVKLGIAGLANVEVGGLSEGDRVVIGAATLKDRQRVSPTAAPLANPEKQKGTEPGAR